MTSAAGVSGKHDITMDVDRQDVQGGAGALHLASQKS
jgi:hypothetical protein